MRETVSLDRQFRQGSLLDRLVGSLDKRVHDPYPTPLQFSTGSESSILRAFHVEANTLNVNGGTYAR